MPRGQGGRGKGEGGVADLRDRICFGSRNILGRNLRPAHDQLADFAGRQFFRVVDRRNRLIGDANHAPVDRIELAADADAGPRDPFALPFRPAPPPLRSSPPASTRSRHRACASWRQVPTQASVDRSTSPAPGRRRKTLAEATRMRSPVFAQCSLSTRHTAGDANACVTCQSFAAASNLVGSADAGREKSICWQHGRHTHRRIEQREQREAARSMPPGLDVVRS